MDEHEKLQDSRLTPCWNQACWNRWDFPLVPTVTTDGSRLNNTIDNTNKQQAIETLQSDYKSNQIKSNQTKPTLTKQAFNIYND
jgi:hypothetical protein